MLFECISANIMISQGIPRRQSSRRESLSGCGT